MFLPFNSDAGSEHLPEKLQFRCAESLALGRSHADGAVILNQEEAPFLAGLHLGHVALFGSHTSQLLKLFLQRGRRRDPFSISCLLTSAPSCQHALQTLSPERISQSADERNAKLGVRAGEEAICFRRKPPVLGGAADG